jgi:biotin carboxyl carrier protein
MKLIAEQNNERREIELTQNSSNLTAEIDGKKYEIEVSEPEPNVYLLKHENKIYQIFVAPNDKPSEPFAVTVGNHNFEIKIFDSKRLRGKGVESGQTTGASEIKTAMPGKVVRVLAKVGAETKQGDGVIIVEAMKMQNEMKSPKDGVIKEIRFAEGATVNAGDILVVIE